MPKTRRCTALLGRVLSVLLAFALLLPLPMVIVPDAQAVTQAEIDSLKADASSLDKKKAELQKQLKAIAADKNKAMDQKELLERQVDVIQSEIGNINQQISKYDELITQAQTGIVETEQEEAQLYELFCQRVRYMEEEGDVNYWAILFNAASFSDLLDRLIMVDEIMEYDNAVMDSLIATRQQLQESKTQMEQARTEQQAAKDKQVAARKELESRESEVDKLISQIKKQQDQVEHSVKELEALAKQMDAEIARKQKELADKLNALNIHAETDCRSEKLGYKIREAQMQKIPYMLVIGDRDMENGTVSVRTRKGEDLGAMTPDAFIAKCLMEIATKSKEV